MHLGATNTTERQSFVESAKFICSLFAPTPFGVLILNDELRCIAANRFFDSSVRSISEDYATLSNSVDSHDISTNLASEIRNNAEFSRALSSGLSGKFVVVESGHPPGFAPGDGRWQIFVVPFVVANERGVVVLFEDITDHHLTHEALQAAEQRFRVLVDGAADGIVIFRTEILLYVNPEAVRLFGYQSPDEIVGRSLPELVEGGHKASFVATLINLAASQSAGVFETAFLRHDGTTFPVECRVSYTSVDETGAGFLFFRNIADRKLLQSRRENAKRIDSLARFSTSVGSELQSIANRLRRLASRIRESDDERETLGGELLQLTFDLSERANQFVLMGEPLTHGTDSISLEELLSRVCARLTQSGESAKPSRSAAGNPVENPTDLLVDLEPSEYAIRGDPSLIERSLITLVLAAWRSRSQQSKLRILGKRSTDNEKRYCYYLTISGADVPQRTAAFSSPSIPFPPTASPFGSWENGKDLDLLGAFASLQAQGCWVDTQVGSRGGLGFELELVLDPNRSLSVDSVPGTQDSERSVENGTGIMATEELTPPTTRSAPPERPTNDRGFPPILICDDEPRLVALTAGLLREFGFEVLTVRSGADAVKTVQTEPVDLVVLDINLPGEDAHEVILGMLREPPISVILSSGYTEEDVDPVLLREPAVKAFLSKPYTVDVLVQTIDRVRSELARSPRAFAKT